MLAVIDHRPKAQVAPQGQARPDPSARRRRDPAPSRLAYRLERMWMKPMWRRVVRVGLPVAVTLAVAGLWLADQDRRALLTGGFDAIVAELQSREEFQVHSLAIEGASDPVRRAVGAMMPVDLPASSFDIDLAALRMQLMALDAVETVDLRIRPGGVLTAVVTERVPALLWRHARGIDILDGGGHRVASVTSREVRPDLPVIAGEGADEAAPEAMALLDAAGPILPRLRGLVRMGERRWDVVLDGGQRLLLPEQGAVAALESALALDAGAGLLGRDVAQVDLRAPGRRVVRLGLDARNAIRAARGQGLLGPDGQPLPEDEDGDAAGKGTEG